MRTLCRLSAVVLWLSLILPASQSSATILIAMDIDALVQNAEIVIRGHVELSESFWDDRVIVTDTTVVVDECLAGPCDDRVVVRQAGGEVGNLTMEVAGMRRLEPGDELVLFLRPNDATGHLMSVGQCQGVVRLDEDRLIRDLSDVTLVSDTGVVVGIPELPATLGELRALVAE